MLETAYLLHPLKRETEFMFQVQDLSSELATLTRFLLLQMQHDLLTVIGIFSFHFKCSTSTIILFLCSEQVIKVETCFKGYALYFMISL